MVIYLLLNDFFRKVDPTDTPMNDGTTPLMAANFNGLPNVIQLLLIYNADTTLKTQDGLAALRLATVKGHYEVVSILIEHLLSQSIKIIFYCNKLYLKDSLTYFELWILPLFLLF